MGIDETLIGRVAVVTGATRGLGRAIGERLEAAGARIVAIDLLDMMSVVPAQWQGVALDLAADDADVRLAALAAELGTVDVVVANAGIVPPWRGFEDLDRAEWDHVMRVNTWSVAATIGAFAPALERSGHGAIVAMASINGYTAHAKQALYTASKHAVVGIIRAAALDLGPRGIRVNGLAPGPIATEALLSRIRARHAQGGPTVEETLRSLAGDAALGRLATPEDVANVAHFLASDASAGMTGRVLPVEAGLG
ncbi:SDR family oxidoreductase [Loktanella sp. SALINAS62]|uniref:SDR family NAD(P)-dependent oxidoreductase n=1 Tax=Loktanella sp. SALINAS62 TaxID=2706124 RepID=UPI001B8D8934|nr:SDR family oxidoreductase [Loktanella sp. SALINAS62]MBS1301486.1 SDR family oxidoreductase [Loktanella sp. SALINAS62]